MGSSDSERMMVAVFRETSFSIFCENKSAGIYIKEEKSHLFQNRSSVETV